MDYKPADFFLGVVDFLAVLVPGAVLAFALTPYAEAVFGFGHLFPTILDTTTRWAAFLVVAYIAGHFSASIASSLLDPLYDRTYRNFHRLPKVKPEISFLVKVRTAWKLKSEDASDSLLALAREVRQKQIEALALPSGPANLTKGSLLMWAQSHITLRSSPAAAEIERYQANSKFFRSMTVVLFFLVPLTIFQEHLSWLFLGRIALIVLLLILFCYRFMQLRWEATRRTYEYFLLLALSGEQFARAQPGPAESCHASPE